MRRLAVVIALAAVTAGTALAAPGSPERHAYTAADQAWAKRINLSPRDVPGFKPGAPNAQQGPSRLTCSSFAPDLSKYTITGQSVSRSFTRPGDATSLFSAAEVFRSVADERGDWAKSATKQALPCVAHMLEHLSTPGVRIAVHSTAMRSAPHLGDHAISFRIVASLSANGASVKTWFDMLGVSRGRADATLGLFSFRRAPSDAFERGLLAKLASRL
jgi:hypothetical protein